MAPAGREVTTTRDRERRDQELKLASSLLAPPSTHQHRDAGIGFRLRNTSRNGVRSRYGQAAELCCEVWVRLALLLVRFEQQQQPPPPYLSRFQRDTRVPAAARWLASLQRLTVRITPLSCPVTPSDHQENVKYKRMREMYSSHSLL